MAFFKEDPTTERVCFSKSINGCLNAIYKRINYNENIYVYKLDRPIDNYKHKSNKELNKEKLVYDSHITKEVWVLEPCKVVLVGIIKVSKRRALNNKKTIDNGFVKVKNFKFKYNWFSKDKPSKLKLVKMNDYLYNIYKNDDCGYENVNEKDKKTFKMVLKSCNKDCLFLLNNQNALLAYVIYDEFTKRIDKVIKSEYLDYSEELFLIKAAKRKFSLEI